MTGRRAEQAPADAAVRYRDRFDSIAEVERLARRRLPHAMWDRLMGGADGGLTARANVQAFSDVWFRPRGAAAYPSRSTATTVAGTPIDIPVILAPMGGLRLQHPDGVLAAIGAAGRAKTICAVSAGSGHRLEEIDPPAGSALWYQLTTALGGREAAEADIDALAAKGFAAAVVTIDSVLRAKTPPIRITPASALRFGPDLVRHPRWTVGFIRDGMRVGVANTAMGASAAPAGRPVAWDDFAWIRERWLGPLVIKGVMRADDARRAVDAGADVVVVSNHGGLTIDGAAPTLYALADVLDAVGGRAEVLVDGGVRTGRDVVKAMALGARAVLIGRPYVMGLAVNGAAGVSRVLEIIREDIDRALAFLGRANVLELDRGDVDVRWPTRA
jgi:isopentenyl diphosphate isomerase/L-lactate dehydrogenase-like FMN-dependent dehydrogenase